MKVAPLKAGCWKVYNRLRSYLRIARSKYELTGECLKCGQCCDAGVHIWMRAKDGMVGLKKLDGIACRYLNKETKLCSIYHRRPYLCKHWPFYPNNIKPFMETCGYRLVKKKR